MTRFRLKLILFHFFILLLSKISSVITVTSCTTNCAGCMVLYPSKQKREQITYYRLDIQTNNSLVDLPLLEHLVDLLPLHETHFCIFSVCFSMYISTSQVSSHILLSKNTIAFVKLPEVKSLQETKTKSRQPSKSKKLYSQVRERDRGDASASVGKTPVSVFDIPKIKKLLASLIEFDTSFPCCIDDSIHVTSFLGQVAIRPPQLSREWIH